MEHIIFHSIMLHLDQNNILNDYHRPNYSFQSQLVMLTGKAMDQQK